jgi:hypothetical protein
MLGVVMKVDVESCVLVGMEWYCSKGFVWRGLFASPYSRDNEQSGTVVVNVVELVGPRSRSIQHEATGSPRAVTCLMTPRA